MSPIRKPLMGEFALGCRPDPPDSRDLVLGVPIYDLPREIDWSSFLTPVRDQGSEGACVGFAVTAMKEFQEWQQHGKRYDLSERWAYEMAKEHDEWPGTDYEGTSIRGAMKALAQHGICEERYWAYVAEQKQEPHVEAAEQAYQFRIAKYRNLTSPTRSLTVLRRALHETGPICCGFGVHDTWFSVGGDGMIEASTGGVLGLHAVLVVAYDEKVLKIKNSWGKDWGAQGYGFLGIDYAMEVLHSGWAATDA